MKRLIKLPSYTIKTLIEMKKEFLSKGYTYICPIPNPRRNEKDWSCLTCEYLFPKCEENNCCPCEVYTQKYLLKRINELIKYNKENI